MNNKSSESVAAMGAVVDSDSEEEEKYQEKVGNSDVGIDCSGILKPITDLTSKNKRDTIEWQTEHQKALDEAGKCLTNEPVLKLYHKAREHVLQTEASSDQIGATLLQREEDGKL